MELIFNAGPVEPPIMIVLGFNDFVSVIFFTTQGEKLRPVKQRKAAEYAIFLMVSDLCLRRLYDSVTIKSATEPHFKRFTFR